MSEQKCPACGADKRNQEFSDSAWECGSEAFADLDVASGDVGSEFVQSDQCRIRQRDALL